MLRHDLFSYTLFLSKEEIPVQLKLLNPHISPFEYRYFPIFLCRALPLKETNTVYGHRDLLNIFHSKETLTIEDILKKVL